MTYLGKETRFTWCGHSTFLVEIPSGRRVIFDPWLKENPSCPDALKDPSDIDLIIITHGHFDHIADAIPLAKKTGAQVVCNFEIGHYFQQKGVEDVVQMNKGGTVEACALQIHMTNAFHSSGILDGDQMIYGGEPAGYVIETENETTPSSYARSSTATVFAGV